MLPTHGRYEYSNITKRPDYAWRLFELLDGLGLPAEAQMNTAIYRWRRTFPRSCARGAKSSDTA